MSEFGLYDLMEGVEQVSGEPVMIPAQEKLLEAGRKLYTNGVKRAIFHGPCGSGKTIVAACQTKRALGMGKTVLHMVHRRRLVDQMIWTLERFGIKAAPIMEGRETFNSPVYCASRDTLLAMLKEGKTLPVKDLLIQDECHVKATEVQDWYLKNFPGMYWTGYTATPVQTNGDSLNPPWQAMASMGQAPDMIAMGRLVHVKVFNPDNVGRRRRKGEKVKPAGDPVQHWLRYSPGKATVAYCATVAESIALVEKYRAAGVSAEHIDANTPEKEREKIFVRSKVGHTKVISNCGVLVEGIDLPWLEVCQLLRGCNSLVLWHQAPGRVMRPWPGKEFGIVYDHAAAAYEFGIPDGFFEWSLDDEGGLKKANKPPKDRQPVTCPRCGLVFAPKPACPECGKVMPKKRRSSLLDSVSTDHAVLTEFNGQQSGDIGADAMARLFKKFYYTAKAQGKGMNAVAAMFSKAAKMPPWDAGLPFNLPHGKAEWQTPAANFNIFQEAQ